MTMGESQYFDDYAGLGYGSAPIIPYTRPYAGYGGAYGGYGAAPLPPFAVAPLPAYGAVGHASLAAPLAAGFGSQSYGPYAPASYQFGYGVQTADYSGAAEFGHNEERTPLGTVGHYHVNTPGSYQSVSYNVGPH